MKILKEKINWTVLVLPVSRSVAQYSRSWEKHWTASHVSPRDLWR